MRFDIVGLAELQIDPSTIGLYSTDARAEMLVRISDAFVIGFAVLIHFSIRIRITQMPELSDELLTLFISPQFVPRVLLFGTDDRLDVSDRSREGLRGSLFFPSW